MQELIKITKNEKGQEVVSARELHSYLESKQDFSTWIKNRIDKYDFVENQDYSRFHTKMEANNATLIEYAITKDMAKELSMVEGNDKGKQARKYFIEMEKKATAPMTLAELHLQNAQILVQLEQKQIQQEKRIQLLEAKTITHPEDYMSVAGYAAIHKIKISLQFAAQIGRRAAAICKSRGLKVDKVRDVRFGEVGVYPIDVLDELFVIG